MADVNEVPDECGPISPDRQYDVADEDQIFVVKDDQESSSSSADDVNKPKIYSYEELVDLCGRLGMSSEMVDGVLVQLMIQHFSYPDHYLYPNLRSVYWADSPADRTLNIYAFTTWQGPESVDSPAIVYNNLGQKPQRIAIGDQFYHSQSRPEAEGFARQYHGAHRLMCIGNTDGQAELLASELSEWLTAFSSWLVKNLPFYDFQVGSREQPRLYSELGNKVGVAFTVSYSYLWAWEMVPAGPPLKAVSLHVDH